jgi:hypothetical protein
MQKLRKPIPKHSGDMSLYIDIAQIGQAIGNAANAVGTSIATTYSNAEAWAAKHPLAVSTGISVAVGYAFYAIS